MQCAQYGSRVELLSLPRDVAYGELRKVYGLNVVDWAWDVCNSRRRPADDATVSIKSELREIQVNDAESVQIRNQKDCT